MDKFDVPYDNDGKIVDLLTEDPLAPLPEEVVRQQYLRILHFEYRYSIDVLAKEVTIQYGSGVLLDSKNEPVRADIVVYRTPAGKSARDQGRIDLVVECKAPTEKDGHNQLVSYIFNTSADGGVWFDGEDVKYFRRFQEPTQDLVSWIGIPRSRESWAALGRSPKTNLIRPTDIRGLLRRCHNKLHGRGVDGEEEDLTMDMVRIILSKAADEEQSDPLPTFCCTPEEYRTEVGRRSAAERVRHLFSHVVRDNPDVFHESEHIGVGDRAICDVVNELQRYRLLSDLQDSEDWDVMGYAYEQYTATYLKRSRGQFFTNRQIVNFMVAALDPGYDSIVLDPAGGSGGFLTGAMRYVRRKILGSHGTAIAKQRQLDKHRTNLFMVEISRRLVKIAKTAMILNGDGHVGMTQGDSLGDPTNLNERVRARAGLEKPNIVLTNPPFAGVGEGRVTDEAVLNNFSTGVRWTTRSGEYRSTETLPADGVPPELLFFERCLQWLAPKGRLGIVMPKSFLDTSTYIAARHLPLNSFRLLGVVTCHKNTFQPHTGVRTCIVFVEKPDATGELPEEYPIFMAISRKIGQDSEGFPIFKRSANNTLTDEIDHDLDEVLADFRALHASSFTPSEYRFAIRRSEIDDKLRINPQNYLPNINETLRQIESVDALEGWSVSTVGQLEKDIQIFKGPRLKTEDLIVKDTGADVEPYYTPSAVLQEKGDSVKLLDVGRATEKQKRSIAAVRVRRGDIVVTRSGTIGRVAIITEKLQHAIVSDDLIRIRIEDETVRHYVFAYLQTPAAFDQMRRNEYGAVQQHLEPEHIADILIPVPDAWSSVGALIDRTRELVTAKEALDKATNKALEAADDLVGTLLSG